MRSPPVRFFAILAILAAPLSAQAGRIAFEQFTLPNGLQVIYSEDHSTPLVSVDVWYHVSSLNGSTQEDRTNYFETVPSNRLNLALWLEADRMRSLAITQANFENQRETVKEERRLGVDNRPYAAAFTDGIAWP